MSHAARMTETLLQTFVSPQPEQAAAVQLYLEAGATPLTRGSALVPAGSTASFATYFNAFPASYWQHWCDIGAVRLSISTTGNGTLRVMRSDAAGTAHPVQTATPTGSTESTFELPLSGFDEGGWYWFEVEADDDVGIAAARWTTEAAVTQPGTLCLSITTLDKPDYVIATLDTLADAPELLAELDTVFVVDQGSRLVADQPGFAEISARLGAKLRIIRQGNLGGAGGYSRGMAEALDRPDAAFVMLLDDDVQVEPEGILRALRFARHCARPLIVGGHMFDLNEPTVLHAYSEIVEPRTFMWGPPDRDHERHDFRAGSLRETDWLHRREDSDFNGWFMCLIPTSVLREIGLALPVFIKWDDAEFGLRAAAAGYPTVAFPGAALWHISWLDKDDTIRWQAYFHARNRLVAALLHSKAPGGGALLNESRKQDLKHLLSMQYYPVELRHQAIRDVLDGPRLLRANLPTIFTRLRTIGADFPELRSYSEQDAPTAVEGRVAYPPTDGKGPRGTALLSFMARATLRHWLTKPDPRFTAAPQRELAKRDATWWRLPGLDSALVDAADGSGASWYTRDRAQFRRRLRQSLRLHRRLARHWRVLQHEYRAALAEITSVEEWRRTFEA